MPLRTHRHGDDRRPVRVVVPVEPPALTLPAARILLRILIKAQSAQEGTSQMTGNTAEASPAEEER